MNKHYLLLDFFGQQTDQIVRINKQTIERFNSEKLLTMDPNQTCEVIVSHLKQSNLNFNLVESPFGVKIDIKKTFIRDQNGVPRTSGISDRNFQLLEENQNLRNIASGQSNEILNYQHAVHTLGLRLEKAKVQIADILREKKEVIVAKESVESALDDKFVKVHFCKRKFSRKSSPVIQVRHQSPQYTL